MAFMNIMALRRAAMALKSLSEYLPLHSVSDGRHMCETDAPA